MRITVFTGFGLWILLVIPGASSLRNVQLIVPEAAERGSKVEFKCQYDLEQEVLYSVKWYRGDREFCRYSPRDVPPLKVFRIPGIDVDKTESDSERLTIVNLTNAANGKYTCEVSADAPSFQTSQVHGFMHIVDLPESDPVLSGIRFQYKPGMKLKAECVSRNSMPPANLSFYINSEPASSQHVWHRVEVDKDKLMSAYSNIQFVVQKHHFKNHRLKLRCTALIYSIYHRSVEKSAMEVREETKSTEEPLVIKDRVYRVHRPPKTHAGGMANRCSNLNIALFISSLLLPTVLR